MLDFLKGFMLVFKQFLWLFLMILGLVLVSIICWNLKLYTPIFYIMVIGAYFFVWYVPYVVFLSPLRIKRDNLYLWLDQPTDRELVSQLSDIDVKGLMENLEAVSKCLKVYAGFDVFKLRLLKGYFKTKNSEGHMEILSRSIITVLTGPILLFAINNRETLEVLKPSDFPDVNPMFLTILNFITLGWYFMSILAALTTDYAINKKRNRLLEEILDACISDLEQKK
ncbi:hypothetical protein [Bacillus sp. NSP9.1]|uniref:hypothetical protein n=1 Tax=Bacillus sp. NSP9.1 TaxID=1071078 RepID=UPI00041A734D|nr:hypothetical protein [Bacillus sp. NSP9.1]QHZ46481.1 hypothetical protein M654_009320 [Bacillus sp. NSP9.1]